MSSPSGPHNPSAIYIGAVVAVLALSSVGIILRVLAAQRARAAARNALSGPLGYPQRPQSQAMPMPGYHPQPRPPPNTYAQNRPPLQETWSMPAPAYSPPYRPPTSQPPRSPRYNNTTPPAPSFPTPQAAQPPRSIPPFEPEASPSNPPAEVNFPSEPPRTITNPPEQPLSLVERMREVQNLMLEIHRLESDASSQNNRAQIQELQRRVTALSDTEGQSSPSADNTGVINNASNPPPYTLDGRKGP